jgi:SpoVK/Ycf46/Vps4 family AAA+-type ATPase
MAFHWSDIGGMEDLKRELIETVQWRFEVTFISDGLILIKLIL